MSIVDEITRLTSAKADIKAAIEAKGVTVPAAATLDAFPSYVSAISGGGGGGNWWDDVINGTWDRCITMTAASIPSSIATYLFRTTPVAESFTLSLPNATWIDSNAFGSAGVSYVYAPLVEVVGAYAFTACSKLINVYFPKLRYISSYGFSGCSHLLAFSSPSVSYLASGAFYNCYSLETVRIGDNISTLSLNRYCLNYCSHLKSLYLLAKSNLYAGRSDLFSGTPMVSSGYIGEFGSIFVRESLYSRFISDYIFSQVKSRVVSLTDAQIAALP